MYSCIWWAKDVIEIEIITFILINESHEDVIILMVLSPSNNSANVPTFIVLCHRLLYHRESFMTEPEDYLISRDVPVTCSHSQDTLMFVNIIDSEKMNSTGIDRNTACIFTHSWGHVHS